MEAVTAVTAVTDTVETGRDIIIMLEDKVKEKIRPDIHLNMNQSVT